MQWTCWKIAQQWLQLLGSMWSPEVFGQSNASCRLVIRFLVKCRLIDVFFIFSRLNTDKKNSISIDYENNFFHSITKIEAFTLTDFMGSVGGIMGLIAGASFISLIELLYHILVKLCSQKSEVQPEVLQPKVLNINRDHVLYQFSKYFRHFTQESSIHGLIYTTGKRQKTVEKVVWASIVVISLTICGFIVSYTLEHAELNPTVMRIDDKVWNTKEVSELFGKKTVNFILHHQFRFHFLQSLIVLVLMLGTIGIIIYVWTTKIASKLTKLKCK